MRRASTLHHAAIAAGAAGHQDLAVVEEVHLAGELARPVHREDVRPIMIVGVENLDRPLEHEKEIDAALAALKHQVAGVEALLRSYPATRATISPLSRGKVCASRA